MRAFPIRPRTIHLILTLGILWLLVAACSSSEPVTAVKLTVTTTVEQGAVAASVPEATSAPEPTLEATPSLRVRLNAVGDLMMARDIITLMDDNGSVYPFEAVRSLLADADITIANFEGTFTDRGEAADKFYTFRTPPGHAVGLAEAGIDVVSLGNNHAMDYGAEGLEDTLAALTTAGVLFSGAGPDERASRLPALLESNGLRVAFLSYNGVQEATFAGPDSAGVAPANAGLIRTDVEASLEMADLVVVSLHAGTEYEDQPTGQQRSLATAAIDAGAVLVLGHHAHVFQGWQAYDGGIIVWGLGNFVFDLDFDDLETLGPRPFQTAVLRFELSVEGVESVSARPVYIDPLQNRPLPASAESLEAIETRIQRLNEALQ